ncbi:Hypothetical protein, putative [Bodo saltans]|uniref:Uncharacterized protein n=1 Tax=Bodo saltans TaxID=75058 RepID=A0A0S4JFI1_BODSA|nr:Hypothetical protein, putative [Bodo saltans]|eukprot:CUG88896.1 Hypothetical protein, putative [Bodo saltans]
MPNLVVNVTFNPPVVKLMGATLREETIHKLEQVLPNVTTTHVSHNKEAPKFQLLQNPSHWHADLGQHYCDQLGRSLIFLALIETLEGEDWKLKGTNTVTHPDNGKDSTKFFFFRA